jgi:hypothetical protein
MFWNCSSWPPVKVSRFRPFLSYIENLWALGPISKGQGPRWAHFSIYRRVLRAILLSLRYWNRTFPQNCSSWPPVTLVFRHQPLRPSLLCISCVIWYFIKYPALVSYYPWGRVIFMVILRVARFCVMVESSRFGSSWTDCHPSIPGDQYFALSVRRWKLAEIWPRASPLRLPRQHSIWKRLLKKRLKRLKHT